MMEVIENESTIYQFAYIRKRGCGEAIKYLDNKLKKMNKSLILSFDIRSAFDRINRDVMMNIMDNKFGNNEFIKIYK